MGLPKLSQPESNGDGRSTGLETRLPAATEPLSCQGSARRSGLLGLKRQHSVSEVSGLRGKPLLFRDKLVHTKGVYENRALF